MKTLGIMIRRKKSTSQKILNKEIITLHQKIKKKEHVSVFGSGQQPKHASLRPREVALTYAV